MLSIKSQLFTISDVVAIDSSDLGVILQVNDDSSYQVYDLFSGDTIKLMEVQLDLATSDIIIAFFYKYKHVVDLGKSLNILSMKDLFYYIPSLEGKIIGTLARYFSKNQKELAKIVLERIK